MTLRIWFRLNGILFMLLVSSCQQHKTSISAVEDLFKQHNYSEVASIANDLSLEEVKAPELLDMIAQSYNSVGDFTRAVLVREQIQSIEPTNIRNCKQLASLYTKVGNLEEAEKTYVYALSFEPLNFAVIIELSSLYNDLGKPLLARNLLRSVNLNDIPGQYDEVEMMISLFQLNDFKNASLILEEVEDSDFFLGNPRALEVGAYLKVIQEDLVSACAYLDRAIRFYKSRISPNSLVYSNYERGKIESRLNGLKSKVDSICN